MNVAKNWALAIMLISFAHFSSELLLKEQMIISVKKMLNNAGHINAKLIDFSELFKKKSSEIGCFLLIVSCQSFPAKFRVKSTDFSKNSPLKILPNLTFFRWNPAKSANFPANFDFFPAKIPWNRPIFLRIWPWKSCEILLFFPRNIRSPVFELFFPVCLYFDEFMWIMSIGIWPSSFSNS